MKQEWPFRPSARNPLIAYDGVVTREAAAAVEPMSADLARPDIDRGIELVLAFLNTTDAETGTDVLDAPDSWRRWCSERRLTRVPDAGAARTVRDAMRAAVTVGQGPDVEAWPTEVVLRGGVPALVGTDALSTVLTAAVHLVHLGHWDRIKICPADDCLWAFYDRSRNRSRTWCSMQVCGNRKTARSWRERHVRN